MTEYERQLGFYVEPETRKQTEAYFERYWLLKSEYNAKWKSILETIYVVSGPNFPHVKFHSGFEFLALRGGRVFTEQDFSFLSHCIKNIGDENFVLVENVDENNPHHGEPPLRFKFPSCITWSELMAGGYVSQELFEAPVKEYFVFGDTGTWGKYVANDYVYPLDIVGFQRRYSELFKKQFAPLIEPQTAEWLPREYIE